MIEKNTKIKFTNARLLAVQTIYAHDFSDESWDKITSRVLLGEMGGEALIEENAHEERVELPAADAELFTRLIKAFSTHADEIDDAIRSALSDNINFDNIEPTLRAILRAGMAEFYANPDLDAPIIINEYVDMTRAFFDGAETKITNALLDRFNKVMRG